ncbi:MAG: HemK/PrmC family methyltransferase [Candidatus Saccharibacteria bacterium]|nr:HemK/PrmC family methyltransferase [Candidatus Saccharibacteria bacterium]
MPKLNVRQWLQQAITQLKAASFITNPRLEAELLITLLLDLDRLQLQLHLDRELTTVEVKTVNQLLSQRLNNYPFAYLAGSQEFYGRQFIVNEQVLIPRPESEIIIEEALLIIKRDFYNDKIINILDVGCGSGALGISLAKELILKKIPAKLTMSDISEDALSVARQNLQKHAIAADLVISDLLTNINQPSDIILANLPYVNPEWDFIQNVDFEPKLALFAQDNGLKLIKKLIDQLIDKKKLFAKSWVFLESDPCQQPTIKKYLQHNFIENFYFNHFITVFKIPD